MTSVTINATELDRIASPFRGPRAEESIRPAASRSGGIKSTRWRAPHRERVRVKGEGMG